MKEFHEGGNELNENTEEEIPESGRKKRFGWGRWFVFALIVISALYTVLYISNVIVVNRLLIERNQLTKQYNNLINGNKILKAELNKLQSAEWINKIARDSLGMEKSKTVPEIIK